MTAVSDLDRDGLVVVTGGGGFIGGHLVAELRRRGFGRVRAVDVKPTDRWYQQHDGVENVVADLRDVGRLPDARPPARATSSTSPRTWAAWASSRRTRPSACSPS